MISFIFKAHLLIGWVVLFQLLAYLYLAVVKLIYYYFDLYALINLTTFFWDPESQYLLFPKFDFILCFIIKIGLFFVQNPVFINESIFINNLLELFLINIK